MTMHLRTKKTGLFRRPTSTSRARPGSLFGRSSDQQVQSNMADKDAAARNGEVIHIRQWRDGGFVDLAISA